MWNQPTEPAPENLNELLDWVARDWPADDAWFFLHNLDQAATNASAGMDCSDLVPAAERSAYFEEAAMALSQALFSIREHVTDFNRLSNIRRTLCMALGMRLSVTLLREIWEPLDEPERWLPYPQVMLTPIRTRVDAIDNARSKVEIGLKSRPALGK